MIDREIIKALGEEEVLAALSFDELKLYIIFLLFAKGIKVKESIDFKTIKMAFGDDFTVGRLKNTCRSLIKRGMIKVNFNKMKKGALANNSFINFTMEYELHALLSWHKIRKKVGLDLKETKEDDLKWVCPECAVVSYGWARNTCPECGHKEDKTNP